jgi:hypothetical protein
MAQLKSRLTESSVRQIPRHRRQTIGTTDTVERWSRNSKIQAKSSSGSMSIVIRIDEDTRRCRDETRRAAPTDNGVWRADLSMNPISVEQIQEMQA